MKKTFNVISVIALILVIIGAINWLLVGIFDFNLVEVITGGFNWIARTIYIVVGVSGIYMLVWLIMSKFMLLQRTESRNQYNK
ncbi:MAG: DUF378 domain-containing protein [Clostridia bacterium]